MGCGASNEEENPPPPPRPRTQEEYRAERMRVRAAIRERIMKPLMDFRFATSEREWRRIPGTPSVDDRSEMSLHEQYRQPQLQTDDDLREAITRFDFSTGSRPQSVKSGKSGKSDGHKTHASAGAVSALSHPSASSWNSKPQSSHRSNETEDGGEVKSERSGSASDRQHNNQQSPSNQSLVSTSTGGRITKGEVFAARHSILNKDLHTTGVNIIEHRQSLAKFSNVSSENISSALAGITMSKRHTMTTEDYGAVEAVPNAVVESRIEGDRNLEEKLVQLQEERRIEEEVQRELRRGSVATLGAASRRSVYGASGGSGAYSSSVHGSPGGPGGAYGTDRASHASGILPNPASNQQGGVVEVWDEEMDADDNETLMMIMGGDAQSQAPDTAFGMSRTGFGASPGVGDGAKGSHLRAPSEFDGSSTDLNSNHQRSPTTDRRDGGGTTIEEQSPNSLTHALKGDGGLPGTVPDDGGSPMNPETKYLQNRAEAEIHNGGAQ